MIKDYPIEFGLLIFFIVATGFLALKYVRTVRYFKDYEYKKSFDPLTGLYVREGVKRLIHNYLLNGQLKEFEQRPYRLNHKKRRKADKLCMFTAFIDIDDFKKFNNNFGHSVGDEVLKIIAEIIKNGLMRGEKAARWGGDEMVIAFYAESKADACRRLSLMVEKLSSRAIKNSVGEVIEGLRITVSIGVVKVEFLAENQPLTKETINQIIGKADRLMYEGKEAGKNQIFC